LFVVKKFLFNLSAIYLQFICLLFSILSEYDIIYTNEQNYWHSAPTSMKIHTFVHERTYIIINKALLNKQEKML